MDIISQTISDIKSLKNQGATNIVKVSLSSLKTILTKNPNITAGELKENIKLLISARPTEPFVQNVLSSLIQNLEPFDPQSIINKINTTKAQLQKNEESIIQNGYNLLKDHKVFLTHCHSSTVNNIFIKIKNSARKIKVYSTETRPLYQGRITAKKLSEKGIEVISFVDSSAPYIITNQDKFGIEAVVLGADVLLSDGSIINKIGSFGIAQAAHLLQIPVYVACTLLKYTINNSITIEERSGEEVWPDAPEKIKILNPAFDRIPAEFITSLITENGIIKPSELLSRVNPDIVGINP